MKKWVVWVIVIASFVTLIASTSTALSNVKGWFGDKSTEDTSSETACVQVVDGAEYAL